MGEEEGAALAVAADAAGYFEQVWGQVWARVGVELTPHLLREKFPR